MNKVMVDQLKTFQMFNSYKLHFNQKSYSVKKYGLSPNRFSYNALEKKKDKYIYKKVGDLCQFDDQLSEFISGNMFFNPNIWVGDLLDEEAKERYIKVRSVRQSLSHYVVEDTKSLIRRHGSLIDSIKSGSIVHDVMNGRTNPESYVILDRIFNITPILKKHNMNVIVDSVVNRLEKYDAFISVKGLYVYDEIKYNIRSFVESERLYK